MYCIGLEIHKKTTQACVKDEKGLIVSNDRFLSDIRANNTFLDRLGGADAKVVMEATGFYEFVYDAIEMRGVDVLLAHLLKLKALMAVRAKNDRNDAEMLTELLRIDAVPTSYVPPKDVRILRELTRHRSSLVTESTTLKNKIHAELARRGTRPPTETHSPFTKKHVSWLRSLRRATIDDLLDVLSIIQEKIERVNEEIRERGEK